MKLITVNSSSFLEEIGLGNIDIGYIFLILVILLVILIILFIVQITKYNNLKKRLDKFMIGKNGKSLEKDLIALYEDQKFLKISCDKNQKDIKNINKNLEYTFQKIGIVKYDAFKQMGGQLSFCLALLNENNDGFILNSVHSSEGCYSYTKEIKKGESDIILGEEEKRALEIAMK